MCIDGSSSARQLRELLSDRCSCLNVLFMMLRYHFHVPLVEEHGLMSWRLQCSDAPSTHEAAGLLSSAWENAGAGAHSKKTFNCTDQPIGSRKPGDHEIQDAAVCLRIRRGWWGRCWSLCWWLRRQSWWPTPTSGLGVVASILTHALVVLPDAAAVFAIPLTIRLVIW